MRRFVTVLLLLCATAHCILSIFYVNVSYLSLGAYASGQTQLPFQHRLLMIPFVRWAQSNHALQVGAVRFGRNVVASEPMTAAKFGCLLLSLALVAGLGLWTTRAARSLQVRTWWLVWALMLAILYASYAARYEQPLWYPYDLPQMVFFGLATASLLQRKLLPFALSMVVSIFLRETSIFLIILAVLLEFRSRSWKFVAAGGMLVWIGSRLLAAHLYPQTVHNENGLTWLRMSAPQHLPQVLSIVGFLWIPALMGRRYLTSRERLALYGASVCMGFSFFFATWNETRVWVEWTLFFAIIAARELEVYFGLLGSGVGDPVAAPLPG